MKALSFRQPWADAILFEKRVENRLKWSGSSFRGRFLIHASKGCTRAEYDDVVRFLEAHGIAWRPRPYEQLVRGAIVGTANVVDVIMPGGLVHAGRGYNPSREGTARHRLADDPYYMGGFALVLEDVSAFEKPIPYVGALGFFNVPDDVLAGTIVPSAPAPDVILQPKLFNT